MRAMNHSVDPGDRQALWVVVAAFIALIVAKLLLVVPAAYGPTILSDELLYTEYARSLAATGEYRGTGYPPLYPLLLSLCLRLGTGFYDAIIQMNVVLSSLVVFPTWLLARLVLPRKEALLCVAVVAVLPYHLVFPRQIMSENLYFPLLLFTLYLCLRVPRKGSELAWDALLAVCIGLLFLTRYLTVALLPVFAIAWLVTNWQPGLKPWLRGLAIATIVLVVVAPWFEMGLSQGLRFKSLVGLGIASNPSPEQRTLLRLGIWTWLYLGYYILLAAPFLHLILAGLPGFARGVWRDGLFRYRIQLAILLVIALLGLAVVRHSWNAAYNFPNFTKIMGRYLVYLPPLFAILAFAMLREARDRLSVWRVVSSQVAALVLVALAYATVILGMVVRTGSRFVNDRGSIDAYVILAAGWAWPAIIVTMIVAGGVLMYRRPAWTAPATAIGAMLAVVAGLPAHERKLREYLPQTVPAAELHRRDIHEEFVVYTRHLKPIERRDPGRAVAASFPFWRLEGKQAKNFPPTAALPGYRHFIVGPSADLADYEAIDTLKVFRARGEEYRLIEVAR